MDTKSREQTEQASLAYLIIIIVGSGITICLLRMLGFPLWLSILLGIPIFLWLFWRLIQFVTRHFRSEKEEHNGLRLRA
ncbi:MAG: hypothetical protein JWQ71_2595 [Pedosphaera sp.]|nr:hypothetical protein [Pedosphaera sp.]